MASSYKEQSVVEAGYATKKIKQKNCWNMNMPDKKLDNYYVVHISNETME